MISIVWSYMTFLNLPINDEKVGFTWTGDGKSMTPEVMQEVLVPLYFSGN